MTNKSKSETVGAPEVPEHLSKHLDHEDEEKTETSKKDAEKVDEDTDSEKDTVLDDEKTDEAIDDIVKSESDDLLAAQDEATAKTTPQEPKRRWWKRARFWKITILLLLVTAITLFAIQSTRHWILNKAGVRASALVVVLDSTTGQPLKNVTVTIDQNTSKTDAEGKARVTNLRLGKQVLQLERVAFAKQTHSVTIGWGSNPLGTFKLNAVGAQYRLNVKEYLSGKPIAGAEASNEEAAAVSNKEGEVVLTLEDTRADQVAVTVTAPGYRSEQITVALEATAPTEVILVPSTKAVFVSKESGRYDVYTMDIDGKNKKVLLAGSGLETGNISLSPSPDGAQVALVSTRDNVRAADGMLLTTLTLIDVASGNTVATDRGESLQILDWVGNRVVYNMVVTGQTADSVNRQRIVSYDYKTNSRAQLINANQIRSAAIAQGRVYYTDGSGYFSIDTNGENKKTVLDKEVWATYRTDYNSLSLQTETSWYRLTLTNGEVSEIAEPVSYANRMYFTNAANEQSLWIEKHNLHLYTIADAKDAILHTQNGLVYPVRWLTNTIATYRVTNNQETADYIISTQGGQARKLINVTSTFGPVQSY